MQMMAKINAKLDIGWKLTTMSCPQCNSTTMAEPKTQITQIYCPKCDKIYPVKAQTEEQTQLKPTNNAQAADEEDNFYEEVYKNFKKNQDKCQLNKAKLQQNQEKNEFELLKAQELSAPFKKTNDVSKKLGQKLLQGWTMLNQSCLDCYSPLMQSKKGEKICCGCDRSFTKVTSSTPAQLKESKVEKVQKVVKQEKEEKQKKVFKTKQQQSKPALKKKVKEQKHRNNSDQNLQLFQKIENKALTFIQTKLDKAIEQNDFSQLQRLLSLVYKIKSHFK